MMQDTMSISFAKMEAACAIKSFTLPMVITAAVYIEHTVETVKFIQMFTL